MSNFIPKPDLLILNGAKVVTNFDEKHPDWPWICIPQPLNPITFKTAKNDPNRLMAILSLSMWTLNENYKNAIRRSVMERGDSNVNIPTHEMCLNFPVETIKLLIRVFPKLVDEVKEQFKTTDSDIVNQDPTDENTHLFKAIRNRLNKRLTLVYQYQQPQQPSPYALPTFAAAGAVTDYVAPANPNGVDLGGYNPAEDEDLPF